MRTRLFPCMLLFSLQAYSQSYDPCTSLIPLECGTPTYAVILSGQGAWDFYPDYSVLSEGKEVMYSFTTTSAGVYVFSTIESNGFPVMCMIKPASGGCNRYSWEVLMNTSYNGYSMAATPPLEAGTEYYLLLDANLSGFDAILGFQIECYQPFDPCATVEPVACGEEAVVELSQGPGVSNLLNCGTYNPYEMNGREAIFSFTAPADGRMAVQVLQAWGIVTYYIAPGSACAESDWTCVGTISWTNGEIMTDGYEVEEGMSYLLMADAVSLYGASHSIVLTCPEIWDSCAQPTPLTCDADVTVTIPPGFGSWDSFTSGECSGSNANYPTYGKEVLYTFTPGQTGLHRVEVVTDSDHMVGYAFRPVSEGCSPEGWRCIGLRAYAGSMQTVEPLEAGTEYYVLLDAAAPQGATHTFRIACETPEDPCPSVTSLSCGESVSIALEEGTGAFPTLSSYYGTLCDGRERVFSFTPSITGTHRLRITGHQGSQAAYFIRQDGSCTAEGWTPIGAVFFGDEDLVLHTPLVAGTPYLILIDTPLDPWLNPPQHQMEIQCPAFTHDLCAEITSIEACGEVVETVHPPGMGIFSAFPDASTAFHAAAGIERVYAFTAPSTGKYGITATDGNGSINYAIRAAGDGCSNEGWTNVGLLEPYMFNDPLMIPMELQVGEEYLLLADPFTADGTQQTFSIACFAAEDPCASITALAPCQDFSFHNFSPGKGAYSFTCENDFPFPRGAELIFSFVTQEAGTYHIEGQQTPGINIYLKPVSEGCGPDGWQCVGQEVGMTFLRPIPFELEAYTGYYLLFQALYDFSGAGQLSLRVNCQSDCTIYADADGDGYGDPDLAFTWCSAMQEGYSPNNDDCHDGTAMIHPGAEEICMNGVDEDCDGLEDDDCVTVSGIQAVQPELNLFPNPAGDRLEIRFSGAAGVPAELRITDPSGRLVRSQAFSAVRGRERWIIEVSDLPAGIYVVGVVQGGFTSAVLLSIAR